MIKKIVLLCVLVITIQFSDVAASYAPCTTPEDCKHIFASEISFVYSQFIKSYVVDELYTVANAADVLMRDKDPAAAAALRTLKQMAENDIEAINEIGANNKDFAEKSERYWKQLKELNTEKKDLSIFEKRQQSKYIDLLNFVLDLWSRTRVVVGKVDMSVLPEFVAIDQDVTKAGTVTSLENKELSTGLVDRIFEYLDIKKYQLQRSW